MTWHWKELLPVDHFSVRTSQPVSDRDRLTLTLLYQPLIGALAHSLYITFLSQLERDQYVSTRLTHRQLMLMLGVSLEVIYEERKKLEAIGLLQTFKQKGNEESSYLYELKPPMTPKQFFENDVLSVYLLNRLGKNQYRELRERFTLHTISKEEYTELTHAFDEVFTSLTHSEMVPNLQSESGNALVIPPEKQLVSKNEKEDLTFKNEQFDFQLFESSLSNMISPQSLTADDKQLISKLAFVYQIEPLEMSSIVSQVLIHSDELDGARLRKRAQEWFKIERGTVPPALGLRVHPVEHQTMSGKEPETEEERTIKFYETIAPLTLLEIRSVGAQVAPADAKMVEALIIDYKLLPGVVNVLLDFILYSHDLKLPKALTEKIAGHWSRKKLQTVQEAMDLALEEKKKFTSDDSKKTGYRKSSGQKNPRQDKLPKWLLEEKGEEKSVNSSPSAKLDHKKEEKSYDQMLEELKKIKEKKR